MRVGMCFDIVYFVLLQISQIAETHLGISYRQVNREHLPEGRLVVQRSEFNHSAGIAQLENLVIRLPVVR